MAAAATPSPAKSWHTAPLTDHHPPRASSGADLECVCYTPDVVLVATQRPIEGRCLQGHRLIPPPSPVRVHGPLTTQPAWVILGVVPQPQSLSAQSPCWGDTNDPAITQHAQAHTWLLRQQPSDWPPGRVTLELLSPSVELGRERQDPNRQFRCPPPRNHLLRRCPRGGARPGRPITRSPPYRPPSAPRSKARQLPVHAFIYSMTCSQRA